MEDVFSRMIVGWSLATHLRASLATEALEMAVWRRGISVEGLAPSVGTVGDSVDCVIPGWRSAR